MCGPNTDRLTRRSNACSEADLPPRRTSGGVRGRSALSLEEVMKKKLLRLLRIVPLALLFASVASAQTTGTIIGVVTDASTGQPVAGAVVIATSPALQGQQTAVTDNAGNYRLQILPPGAY